MTHPCASCGLHCNGECYFEVAEPEDDTLGTPLTDWMARNADLVAADRTRHQLLDLTVQSLGGNRFRVAA